MEKVCRPFSSSTGGYITTNVGSLQGSYTCGSQTTADSVRLLRESPSPNLISHFKSCVCSRSTEHEGTDFLTRFGYTSVLQNKINSVAFTP
jgi:hypothetical protein